MRFLDFHCDTVTVEEINSLSKSTGDIDLDRIDSFCDSYAQVFAIWKDAHRVQDRESEFMAAYHKAIRLFEDVSDRMVFCRTGSDLEKAVTSGKHAAFLSVEDLSFMGSHAGQCREMGISFVLPTWNYENEYGCGAATDQSKGLTPYGKKVLAELTQQGIIPDISHLSDQGVEDLFELTDRPVIASHSNVREIQDCPRNLTRHQIQEVIRRGGIIGMNLFRNFIGNAVPLPMPELLRHMDRILELGGEDVLCMGGDWDGCNEWFPEGITGIESVPVLAEAMEKHGFGSELVNKILFDNGYRFIRDNLK